MARKHKRSKKRRRGLRGFEGLGSLSGPMLNELAAALVACGRRKTAKGKVGCMLTTAKVYRRKGKGKAWRKAKRTSR